MNIILLGPPGAGKGTQADNIVTNFNLFKVSSGDLLRNEIKKGGIVNDPVVHQRICNGIASWFKEDCDLTTLGIVESPIKGPKGNIEFLIAAHS